MEISGEALALVVFWRRRHPRFVDEWLCQLIRDLRWPARVYVADIDFKVFRSIRSNVVEVVREQTKSLSVKHQDGRIGYSFTLRFGNLIVGEEHWVAWSRNPLLKRVHFNKDPYVRKGLAPRKRDKLREDILEGNILLEWKDRERNIFADLIEG